MSPLPKHYLIAATAYLALTGLLLAPLWPQATTAILGGPVADIDGWQNVWNLWWMREALASGRNPFVSDYLYYPLGVELYLQTFNPSNGLLALPITALLGPIAGYNFALALACLLSGLGGYALAYRVSGHRLGAFIGGLCFAYSPFHLTKVYDGQLELIATQWLAFYGLFLLRTVDDRRWADALLAGLCLALIGYTSWYYLLFAAIFSAIFCTLRLIVERGQRPALLARLLSVAALAGLALGPVLVKAVEAGAGQRKTVNIEGTFDSLLLRSANLLDFGLPSYLHPLWGAAAWASGQQWHPYTAGWNMALGYAALALATIGAARAWAAAWPWVVSGVSALLLALGPVLQVGTARYDLPLPYRLLLPIPGVGAAQRPSHFVVITVLCMVPLVALGVRSLLITTASAPLWPKKVLAFLLIGLLIVEFLPPRWASLTLDVHPYYAGLAGSQGAIVELPLYDKANESSDPLEAQLIHGMPLVGGFVSRPPSYNFPRQAPYLRQLVNFTAEPDQLLAQATDGFQALRGYGVTQLVVHPERLDARQRAGLAAALVAVLPGLAPAYADEQLVAYALPELAPQPYAAFDTGWYLQECASACFRWMGSVGSIALVNPTLEARLVRLELRLRPFARARALQLSFDGAPLKVWNAPLEGANLAIELLLAPGSYQLGLSAPTDFERPGGRELSVVVEAARLVSK